MKKILLSLLLLALPFIVYGQQIKFGYFSYQEALKAMPDYAIAQQNLSDLRSKYDAETKRSEDEFNKKYEEFLEGQRDFAPSIRDKRTLPSRKRPNVFSSRLSMMLMHR